MQKTGTAQRRKGGQPAPPGTGASCNFLPRETAAVFQSKGHNAGITAARSPHSKELARQGIAELRVGPVPGHGKIPSCGASEIIDREFPNALVVMQPSSQPCAGGYCGGGKIEFHSRISFEPTGPYKGGSLAASDAITHYCILGVNSPLRLFRGQP